MKTKIFGILIILLILCGGVYRISRFATETVEISVLRDITDVESVNMPEAKNIISLYGYQQSLWKGGIFLYGTISDISLNRKERISIPAASSWLSNKYRREKDIEEFETKIKKIVDEPATPGKERSFIYASIANEMNVLARSSASKRIAIIYSDLMENQAGMSFYNDATLRMLTTDPRLVQKHFEQTEPINELDGIDIYIIYQPSTPTTDAAFQTVSKFYKSLLESKGATVYIQANL